MNWLFWTLHGHDLRTSLVGDNAAEMAHQAHKALVGDVHELAKKMPHVTVAYGAGNNAIYQVGGKSLVFFRGRCSILSSASPVGGCASRRTHSFS
jgi:hypothetical protein